MNRKIITEKLSKAVEHKINPDNDTRIYWAKEVTFQGYTTENSSKIRVDYMEFKPVNLTVYTFGDVSECKQGQKVNHTIKKGMSFQVYSNIFFNH